jgi:hypothetical protein
VLARSLIVGRTRLIGLVVAHLDNQFYPVALEKLSHALQARGYHILVFLAANNGDDVDSVLDDLIDYQVDGILMGSVTISNRLADRCEGPASRSCSSTATSRAATSPRSPPTTAPAPSRRPSTSSPAAIPDRAYRRLPGRLDRRRPRRRLPEGLARHGLALEAFVDCGFRPALARRQALQIFGKADRPDAVFAANDQIAFTVMDTLRYELGLRVPEDVAVIGYDDVAMAAWPAYDLTTVRQDADRMVAATVDPARPHRAPGGPRAAPRRARQPARRARHHPPRGPPPADAGFVTRPFRSGAAGLGWPDRAGREGRDDRLRRHARALPPARGRDLPRRQLARPAAEGAAAAAMARVLANGATS